MGNAPLISVLMPVYNAEKYIGKAITSVLKQSFQNFEFLILDDGSNDRSSQIVESFKDARIKLIKNEKNQGLTAILNQGLKIAQGKYIARMDADDICALNRLQVQFDFMEKNPQIAAAGSWVKTMGVRPTQTWQYRSRSELLRCELLFDSPLAHPSVMLRRETLEKNNLRYASEYLDAEDYGLWLELSRISQIANIPQYLLHYRLHAQQSMNVQSSKRMAAAAIIRKNLIKQLISGVSDNEIALHQKIATLDFEKTQDFVERAEAWFLKLESANKAKNIYQAQALAQTLGYKWWQICNHHCHLGSWMQKKQRSSILSQSYQPGLLEKIKFQIKCALKR